VHNTEGQLNFQLIVKRKDVENDYEIQPRARGMLTKKKNNHRWAKGDVKLCGVVERHRQTPSRGGRLKKERRDVWNQGHWEEWRARKQQKNREKGWGRRKRAEPGFLGRGRDKIGRN